jgi:hypothetical protein
MCCRNFPHAGLVQLILVELAEVGKETFAGGRAKSVDERDEVLSLCHYKGCRRYHLIIHRYW